MTLREYFQKTSGIGVLATADSSSTVDAAVYSIPYVFDDGTVGFIMRQRLTHHNLQSNNSAAYVFLENAPGYRGLRLFLKKVKEETDPSVVEPLMKRHLSPEEDRKKGPKYLVTFSVEKILPIMGGGEATVTKVV